MFIESHIRFSFCISFLDHMERMKEVVLKQAEEELAGKVSTREREGEREERTSLITSKYSGI